MTIKDRYFMYDICKWRTAACFGEPDEGCPGYRYFKNLILKNYNRRLKADIVAVLTDIQLELEEAYMNVNNPYHYGPLDAHRIIQERIDALKGEEK